MCVCQVFEEDWALASHVDSGCPSETLPDDEEPCDWTNTSKPKAGPAHSPQDHLMLEWDPSVDIGGSVSHDDADSSYFSATAGENCWVTSGKERPPPPPTPRHFY